MIYCALIVNNLLMVLQKQFYVITAYCSSTTIAVKQDEICV